jgi:hypothetical protein
MRETANEAAFFERGDKTVDAGFRRQIERFLHLVKRGETPVSLMRSLMKSRSSFCLLVNMLGRLGPNLCSHVFYMCSPFGSIAGGCPQLC